MNIPFTKMHGLGNDFVIAEDDQLPHNVSLADLAKVLCNRHFGIGADGLMIVAPPDNLDCDIQFKFYNADGSQAEMCGNGIRCFARYVKDQGLVSANEFRIQTAVGIVVPHILADGSVTVDMGQPILDPATIPCSFNPGMPVIKKPLQVNDLISVVVSAVSMGNPHCILFMDEQPKPLPPFNEIGPLLEKHPAFPAKTNVEFCTVLDDHTIDVKVWERAVGPTLACGTGACAVAVAGIIQNRVKSPVHINLPGGTLYIEWDGHSHVYMTGPATYVFAGTFPWVGVGALSTVNS